MNFALMFALALGIDYALFIVFRFRAALFGRHEPVEQAVEETMDTAGKAVLFSGAHRADLPERGACSSTARRSARWRSGSCCRSSSCSPRR